MPSRPKSVIIDGIHYAPVDVTEGLALSAEMRGKRAIRLQAEVKRLRAEVERLRDDNHALQAEVILTLEQHERLREAIARHRAEYLGGSIPERDRNLWEALHA